MAEKKVAHLGTGRRKTGVACVRAFEGKGEVTVNGKPFDVYFNEEKDQLAVVHPLIVCDLRNRLDVHIKVRGGGTTGQAGACRQGLARALKSMFNLDTSGAANPTTPAAPAPVDGQPAAAAPVAPVEESAPASMAKRLRDSGFLTRDGRMKERKKYGRKGARRSFQFSKR
jgi:small subunit ribosomal protein S9